MRHYFTDLAQFNSASSANITEAGLLPPHAAPALEYCANSQRFVLCDHLHTCDGVFSPSISKVIVVGTQTVAKFKESDDAANVDLNHASAQPSVQ